MENLRRGRPSNASEMLQGHFEPPARIEHSGPLVAVPDSPWRATATLFARSCDVFGLPVAARVLAALYLSGNNNCTLSILFPIAPGFFVVRAQALYSVHAGNRPASKVLPPSSVVCGFCFLSHWRHSEAIES